MGQRGMGQWGGFGDAVVVPTPVGLADGCLISRRIAEIERLPHDEAQAIVAELHSRAARPESRWVTPAELEVIASRS